MRKLLLPIIIASGSLLAGSLFLRWLSTDYPAPSIHSMARQMCGPDIQQVFIGNSLTTMGIQPSLFSRSSVNFAVDGGHYELLEKIVMRNIEHLPELRRVIIQLDNLCYLYDRISEERDYQQLYDMGVRRVDLVGKGIPLLMQFSCDNWLLYPVFFMKRFNPAKLPEIPDYVSEPGFRSLRIMMTKQMLSERNLLQDEYLLDSKRETQNRDALFRLIDVFKRRRIEIIFLRMPRHEEYIAARSSDWIAREEKMIQLVLAYTGRDTRLVDFRRPAGFDTSDFSDTRHLNYLGAAKFSALLNEELLDDRGI